MALLALFAVLADISFLADGARWSEWSVISHRTFQAGPSNGSWGTLSSLDALAVAYRRVANLEYR